MKEKNTFITCRKHIKDTEKWQSRTFKMFWLGVAYYALDGTIPEWMNDTSGNYQHMKEVFPRVKAFLDKCETSRGKKAAAAIAEVISQEYNINTEEA